jgi:ABC-type glycerol-3-phosphate transport system substrate-binding protein
MPRILFVTVAVLVLAGCSAPPAEPGAPLPEGSSSSSSSWTPSASAETLTNDDPRCKLWSSPLIMLTLILHPVKDVDHFPAPALDATCRWEVAGGTNTIKWPHTYEALWLDADDAAFAQVTAAFEAEGATVAVEEIGGPGPTYGYVRIATISSPDGIGKLDFREPNHDFPGYFMSFTWTRS